MGPIRQLEGNIKENLSLALPELLVVVGPNGSYKSTIPITLRAALLGDPRVPNSLEPDIGSTPADLVTLAATQGHGLRAVARNGDGMAVFEVPVDENGKAKEASGPIYSGDLTTLGRLSQEERESIFVMDNVAALLAPRSKIAKETFLKTFGQDAVLEEPLGLLPEQKKLWAQALEHAGTSSDPGVTFAKVTAWLRQAQTASSSNISAIAARVDIAKKRLAVTENAGAERLPEYERALAEARAYERAKGTYDAAEPTRKRMKTCEIDLQRAKDALAEHRKATSTADRDAKIAALETTLESEARARDEATKALAAAEQKVANAQLLEAQGLALLREMKVLLLPAEGKPPRSCTFGCPQHKDEKTRIAAQRQAATILLREKTKREDETKAAIAEALAKKQIVERRAASFLSLCEELAAAKSDVSVDAEEKKLLAAIQGIEASLINLRSTLPPEPKPYGGLPMKTLEEKIDRIKTVNTARSTAESDALQLNTERAKAAMLKQLIDIAVEQQTGAIQNLVQKAEDTINAYMPKDLRAKIRVLDKGLVWSVENTRRASPFGTTGCREWYSLRIAAAVCMSRAPIKILSQDDVHLGPFDYHNLLDLMRIIGEAKAKDQITQSILVWNRPHEVKGRAPDGWTVIETQAPI